MNSLVDEDIVISTLLNAYQKEMKSKRISHTLYVTLYVTTKPVTRLREIITPEQYSFSHWLSCVTALVLKFIHAVHTRVTHSVAASNVNEARVHWNKDVQLNLIDDPRFDQWNHQFKPFKDNSSVWSVVDEWPIHVSHRLSNIQYLYPKYIISQQD